jgi:5-methylcytosine-specific restriction endonuclease McrA
MRCHWCGRLLKFYHLPQGESAEQPPDQWTIDHLVPIKDCVDFHPNCIENLVPACPACNAGRHNPTKRKNVARYGNWNEL